MPIDELFWFKCVKLQVDSYRFDKSDKESINKCTKLLVKAYEIVENRNNRMSNKVSIYSYMKAMFTYKLALITQEGVLDGRLGEDAVNAHRRKNKYQKVDTMEPSVYKQLSRVCHVSDIGKNNQETIDQMYLILSLSLYLFLFIIAAIKFSYSKTVHNCSIYLATSEKLFK